MFLLCLLGKLPIKNIKKGWGGGGGELKIKVHIPVQWVHGNDVSDSFHHF